MSLKQQGISLYNSGSYNEAIEKLYASLMQEDNADHEVFYYIAVIHAGKREHKEAEKAIKTAIALDPTYGGYRTTYGAILGALNKPKEALEQTTLATQLSPGSPSAHWNLALMQLAANHPYLWECGWQNYEYRLVHKPAHYVRSLLPKPEFVEEYCKGKSLLVHAEQGLGDCILGLRMCKDLKKYFAKVYLECAKELVPLLVDCPYFDGVYAKPNDGAFPYDVDFDIPIMSLFAELTVPMCNMQDYAPPYITPDQETVNMFKPLLPKGFNVGVCWAGSKTHSNDINRSMSCDELKVLADIPGVNLISLSREEHTIEMFASKNFIANAKYTLAFCSTLDYIVSVDTFVANLCGAANIPCAVVHPVVMEWRWHNIDVFYPSCKNFQQTDFGEWQTPLMAVRSHIEGLMQAQKGV